MDSEKLTPKELRRYSRHIMISELGIEGQEKIKKSSVLVVGAGGLGCPALQYLTSAGVGEIGIVEFDTVEEINLQNQILYGYSDIGKLKSILIKERLKNLNDLVSIEIFNLKLIVKNAIDILSGFDLIIDSTGNYATNYLINDACVILNKPMVYGSVNNNKGMVSVFNYCGGPTLRCLKPYYLNNGQIATENNASLGVVSGITGTYIATEAIKILAGFGTVLSGNMLYFNILTNDIYKTTINNIPENHNIKELQSNY